MMQKTKIEWCDMSVNPIRANLRDGSNRIAGHHCVKISPGCKNCYSSKTQPRFGMPEFQDQQNGEVLPFLNELELDKVLRRRKPAKIFWCDMSDMFGDWVPDEWIDQCFAIMALTPHLTHLVLTKRSKRVREYGCGNAVERLRSVKLVEQNGLVSHLGDLFCTWPLPNVWLGVSCEDQKTADERIPDLLATPAAVRFVSAEPLLASVDFSEWLFPRHWEVQESEAEFRHREDCPCDGTGVMPSGIHWVIVGGESGPGARPMHPDWARKIRDDCQAARVPFFFKQWGEYGPIYYRSGYAPVSSPEPKSAYPWGDGAYSLRLGKKAAGRLLDGREWNEFPEVHP